MATLGVALSVAVLVVRLVLLPGVPAMGRAGLAAGAAPSASNVQAASMETLSVQTSPTSGPRLHTTAGGAEMLAARSPVTVDASRGRLTPAHPRPTASRAEAAGWSSRGPPSRLTLR